MQHWEQRQYDWGWSKRRCTELDDEVGTDMMQSSAMSVDQKGFAMYSTARTRKIRHFRYCSAKRQIKSKAAMEIQHNERSERSISFPKNHRMPIIGPPAYSRASTLRTKECLYRGISPIGAPAYNTGSAM